MAMELTHEFTVPTSVGATWEAFGHLEEVAQCFPGATITNVEGDTFEGTAKVKLGPVALVYAGKGEIRDRDEATHTMTLNAQGKDKRGNGTAGADVVLSMREEGGGTKVEVVTQLNVTGKPAQFGRGMMQDVSDKLLGQFVDCLQQRLVEDPAEGAEETNGLGPGDAAVAAARAGGDNDAPLDSSADPIGDERRAGEPSGTRQPDSGEEPRKSHLRPITDADNQGEALDLGAAVLPALLKNYGAQIAGGLVVLLVLRRLFSRNR